MMGRGTVLKEDTPRLPEQIAPDLLALLRRLAVGELRWPLYLYGPTGRGKTCAALWLMDQVPGSLFCTAERLVQWVLEHARSSWELAGDSPLVMVDELGLRSRDSDLEYVAVKQMADLREHRPAIWICNHPPNSIRSTYDDRIYSRICSGTWYELTGADRRMT
jgi:DNA replication protein DnaC